jgi:hypothetical protein
MTLKEIAIKQKERYTFESFISTASDRHEWNGWEDVTDK